MHERAHEGTWVHKDAQACMRIREHAERTRAHVGAQGCTSTHECCIRLPGSCKWGAERMQEVHGRDAEGMHKACTMVHEGCTRVQEAAQEMDENCVGDAQGCTRMAR